MIVNKVNVNFGGGILGSCLILGVVKLQSHLVKVS
jgi:hypothetical protein